LLKFLFIFFRIMSIILQRSRVVDFNGYIILIITEDNPLSVFRIIFF
jgi:hypothetical protein